MIEAANLTLSIALLFCVYSILTLVAGLKKEDSKFLKSGENASIAVFILVTLAISFLLYFFIKDNFALEYVYQNSSKDQALVYKISAVWAGQSGSVLFWEWVLVLFTFLVILTQRKRDRIFLSYSLIPLMITALFFLIILVFATSPFKEMDGIPDDGIGMNPLLQNPGMLFHPPFLYLGYVGFTVPFAFCIAALLSGNLGLFWIVTTRRWAMLSWIFLSIGVILGMGWAYIELGWGGYWAWDPVENASFIPWLFATAYLHSVIIQEKRGMLKGWNVFLIILTFTSCIFGTFITRSGIIASVHAFGESTVGYYFLAFLLFILVSSFGLTYYRKEYLVSENKLDSFLSREATFLLNNWLFVVAAFAIIWGTMYPVVAEAVRGVKVTVGPPFYNQITIPLAILLIFLTGVCPLISWRKATVKNFYRNFLYPVLLSVVGFIILIIKLKSFLALLTFTLCIFVCATIIIEFIKATLVRAKQKQINILFAFYDLFKVNKRRYGGYIVHLGMILIFIGITGSSAFNYDKKISFKKGETAKVKNFNIEFKDYYFTKDKIKEISGVNLLITDNKGNIKSLTPQKYYYIKHEQPTTEVALYSTPKSDLYIILDNLNPKTKNAVIKVIINPLTWWIWFGGIVLVLGGIIAILKEPREERVLKQLKNA